MLFLSLFMLSVGALVRGWYGPPGLHNPKFVVGAAVPLVFIWLWWSMAELGL